MTYIPAKKTLYIRHENVVRDGMPMNQGRIWFGTDDQVAASSNRTIGTAGYDHNLTGTRYEENNYDLYSTTGSHFYWGLKEGTYILEYENIISLSTTASPEILSVRPMNSEYSQPYSPRFTSTNYVPSFYNLPNATGNYTTWNDFTENGVNYRKYSLSKKFTSTGIFSSVANLRFCHHQNSNTAIIEYLYEDIKITKID